MLKWIILKKKEDSISSLENVKNIYTTTFKNKISSANVRRTVQIIIRVVDMVEADSRNIIAVLISK